MRLTPKQHALGAVAFRQKSSSFTRQDVTASQQRAVAVGNGELRSEALREIKTPIFTSTGTAQTGAAGQYSSAFLAQQIAQEQHDYSHDMSAPAYAKATSAYDDTLSLTATLLGFQGFRERVA